MGCPLKHKFLQKLRKILILFDYINSEVIRKHHVKRMGVLKQDQNHIWSKTARYVFEFFPFLFNPIYSDQFRSILFYSVNFVQFCSILLNSAQLCSILLNFAQFCTNLLNSAKYSSILFYAVEFCSNLLNFAQYFNFGQYFNSVQCCSILFNAVQFCSTLIDYLIQTLFKTYQSC